MSCRCFYYSLQFVYRFQQPEPETKEKVTSQDHFYTCTLHRNSANISDLAKYNFFGPLATEGICQEGESSN